MPPSKPASKAVLGLLLVCTVVAAACSESEQSGDEPNDAVEGGTTTVAPGEASGESAGEPGGGEPTYSAEITRTTDNVPHIVAADTSSAAFGVGYVTAEDHLCSLADMILAARSEMAEFHGPGREDRWLHRDLTYAATGLYESAAREFDSADVEAQDGIRALAAGYNQYLGEVGADNVPGWCAGGDWLRPIDEYDLAAHFKVISVRGGLHNFTGFVATAEPPPPANDADESSSGDDSEEVGLGIPADTPIGDLSARPDVGSNAWAVGPDRTTGGTAMMVGTPHLEWEGGWRFYEMQITIPGEYNVYGATIPGAPVIGIGFNENVAWSTTDTSGNAFTVYSLDLVEGDPTSYHYGDEIRQMTSVHVAVEVADGNGSTETIEREVWFSHYGPVVDLPGIGWTNTTVTSLRDANEHYPALGTVHRALNEAENMDDVIAAHESSGGTQIYNMVAASSEGRIWYANNSATPNLSDETIEAWQERLETDIVTRTANERRVVLLDGSNPRDEWVDVADAPRPGLAPLSEHPQLERTDFVLNANDDHIWANPDEIWTETFSPLLGNGQGPSPRTRMLARQLGVTDGDSGEDGLFTLEELAASAFSNRIMTAELLVDQVVDRCLADPIVELDDESIDLTEACTVLDNWDRRADLDSRGTLIWREFIEQYPFFDIYGAGELFGDEADPDDYVNTPSQLAPAGDDDVTLERLAIAVQRLTEAGIAVDTPLGEAQFAIRGDVTIPVPGGYHRTGIANVVGQRGHSSTSEPEIFHGERIGTSSQLRVEGYPITGGTTYIFAVEFTEDGPEGLAILTYGNTGDPSSPHFSTQTQRFAEKNWRSVAFTEEEIAAETVNTYTVSR